MGGLRITGSLCGEGNDLGDALVYRVAGVLAVLVLAACAKPLEVGSVTEIKPPPGTIGTDIYAARRASGEKVPDFAGDQIVDVRSYAVKEGEMAPEIAGARCKLSTGDFSADLTTPAKVRVPIYRNQSSPIAVKCEKEGFKPKLTEVAVFNATDEARLNGAAGAGAGGVLFAALWNAADDDTNDEFKYPTARVELEPVPGAKSAVVKTP